MARAVRVGMIGCGTIGGFHSRNLRNLMRTQALPLQFTAVCDRKQGRADDFARLVGATLAATEAQVLIDSPEVDAVYICTETAEHPRLLDAALAAGKHVFCEKPLACSLADAERMHAAVTRAGVVHQVGLVLNHAPVFAVLEHMMRTLDVGRLLTAQLRDDQFLPIRGHYNSTWRGDVSRSGGGTLIEHSIHDVDLFRRLFGEVAGVRCSTRYTSGHEGIEDVALVRFDHVDGASTSLTSVWHDIDDRPSTRRLEIFFERAWFATEDDYVGAITYQPQKGAAITLSAEEVTAKFLELQGLEAASTDARALAGLGDRRFVEAVLAGAPARPDFGTALAAHRIVDACYRSAAAGADVRL